MLIASLRTPLGALAVIALTGGACDSAATRFPVDAVALEPYGQHPVRLSNALDIALVTEATACVVVSYEGAVARYDPQGAEVALRGSEGEGPGEFPKRGPGAPVPGEPLEPSAGQDRPSGIRERSGWT